MLTRAVVVLVAVGMLVAAPHLSAQASFYGEAGPARWVGVYHSSGALARFTGGVEWPLGAKGGLAADATLLQPTSNRPNTGAFVLSVSGVIHTAGRRARFAPYLIGGYSSFQILSPGWNFGGGFDVRPGAKAAVRVEIRDHVSPYKAGADQFWSFVIGLVQAR